MATIALPTNSVPKRNVTGAIVASRDLSKVTAAATDTVEICELPIGAVVFEVSVVSNNGLGNTQLGISGSDIVDDVDFFRTAVSQTATQILTGNLRLGYEAQTEGEIVTFTSANGVSADEGRAWVLYSMNADIV